MLKQSAEADLMEVGQGRVGSDGEGWWWSEVGFGFGQGFEWVGGGQGRAEGGVEQGAWVGYAKNGGMGWGLAGGLWWVGAGGLGLVGS